MGFITDLFKSAPEPAKLPKKVDKVTEADREEAEKRRRAKALKEGRESTILAGRTLGGGGLGTTGLPTLLGSS